MSPLRPLAVPRSMCGAAPAQDRRGTTSTAGGFPPAGPRVSVALRSTGLVREGRTQLGRRRPLGHARRDALPRLANKRSVTRVESAMARNPRSAGSFPAGLHFRRFVFPSRDDKARPDLALPGQSSRDRGAASRPAGALERMALCNSHSEMQRGRGQSHRRSTLRGWRAVGHPVAAGRPVRLS